MKQKSIALCIILSLLTCGLYSIYWVYSLAEDVNRVTARPNATSGGMVLIFTILTCGIYGLYWVYKSGEALDQLRATHGRAPGHLGILYLVLHLLSLSIITYALMQSELNEYATK